MEGRTNKNKEMEKYKNVTQNTKFKFKNTIKNFHYKPTCEAGSV
jgi:hypothetical protein